ncbi:tyrosine-type recombinase/integrase [Enterococcus mediterraneensis]|uniref:tyrosine-type recombinase/integrase n=1 Tax=Enterococcus mediterraneensis TaxID=2364791 RepID=UPI000F051C2A|nr:site-specific integrase [Enterococcus mediterraneensis]
MAKAYKYEKNGQTFWRKKGYLGTNPLTGEQKNFNRGGFKTSREAEQAYLDAKQNFIKTRGTNLRGTTFREVYELWIETVYKHKVRSATLLSTKSKFKNHILPKLGDKLIDKITVDDIQDFANYIYYDAKHSQARLFLNYVSNVFEFARKRKLVQSDPVLLIEKMRTIRSENEGSKEKETYLSPSDLKIFLEDLKYNCKFNIRVLFYLIFVTGIRNGEAIALQWKDVDFENKVLHVRHSRTRDENGHDTIGLTKNGKSRTIPLSSTAISLLEKLQYFNKLQFNRKNYDQFRDDLVFPSDKGKMLHPSTVYLRLKKIEKRTGLKDLHPHKIRHTFTTYSISLTQNVKEVSEMLGHSDVAFTLNVYAGTSSEAKERIVNELDNIIPKI